MANLRELSERHLSLTLEGPWGLPVNLITPEGVRVDDLRGQILYDTVRMNPETGETVVVEDPIVVLRRTTLESRTRVPLAGETWIVEIPIRPEEAADKKQYLISPTRPPEGGRSVGFIRIYLQDLQQS